MSTAPSLGNVFREASRAEGSTKSADLDGEVAAYAAAAHARWPDLKVQPLDFARYLGERAQDSLVPPLKYAGDLWLACACVQGEARAFEHFMAEYGPVLQRLLLRRGATRDLAADIQQQLAERLLVADPSANRPAKIGDYRGSGALRSWVATAAAMLLVSLQRSARQRQEHPKPIDEDLWIGVSDPELDYLKQRHAGDVRKAILVSLESLSDRDKTLLSLYVGKRLNIDTLGTMYGVNRATAARWIAAARQALRRRTVKHLQTTLRMTQRECDSLIAFVNSQLDISILEHLTPGTPPDTQ
jgi:RNA polymerase sigma-70 factor (ECF subfamily)